MVFEQIMSVDEYVAYDIMNMIDTLRKNQSNVFYNLESHYEIDGAYSYVAVWTKEDEHLVITYNDQTNALIFGYPSDRELKNVVTGEPVLKRFQMTVKPPMVEPGNLRRWQGTLYNLIQEEVSKHVAGVLKDEIRREFLTTVEL